MASPNSAVCSDAQRDAKGGSIEDQGVPAQLKGRTLSPGAW